MDLSSTSNMNESVFHVFLDLLQQWLHAANSLLPAETIALLVDHLKVFGSSMKLITGFSMERIWNARHIPVPATIEIWKAYNKLQTITSRFDAIASIYSGRYKASMYSLYLTLTLCRSYREHNNLETIIS